MAMSVSRRPFRARRVPGRHLGFRRSGSTLGYNPAAASRLSSPRLRISTTLILACALCMAAVPAAAQSITGAIVGRVTDPSDAVIVGASVRAINAATAAVDATTTDDTGFYRIANLVPGEYFVEVEASGFQTARVSAQRLSLADNLRLDVKLEIGETEFSVTVEDIASEVNTEDAQLGRVMRDIPALPVLSTDGGRSVVALLHTQPGVTPAFGGFGFSFNGQRGRQNQFVFDGTNSNSLVSNERLVVDTISPNAVAEFRLVTGAMKAEYGRNAGGVVIVTTKSGGNEFHGAATEVFRNTKLNAVPFFQKSVAGGTRERFPGGLPRKPTYNGNDFDVNLGGPIRRDKTFFFGSYLGFRRRREVAYTSTVPNSEERKLIETFGAPEARSLLKLIPPATVGNTLFNSPKDEVDRHQGLLKADHYFSARNRLSASYFLEENRVLQPAGMLGARRIIPGFGFDVGVQERKFVARNTHSFGPNLFHDVRFSFTRFAFLVTPENRIEGLSPPLNDFAHGFATVFFQWSTTRLEDRTRTVSLFLQDDWKPRRNLTLNLGLRWEYHSPLKDNGGRIAALRPGRQSSVFPDAPLGLVFPGDSGISESTYSKDWNNFAPRFGFAWDVAGNGRLSLRGGYGLFYEVHNFLATVRAKGTAPFAIRPQSFFTRYADPWEASLVNPSPQPFPYVPPKVGDPFDFTTVAPVFFSTVAPTFRTPYGQQWNLQVQYEVRPNWLLEVGYVGSNGVKLYNRQEVNPAIPGPGANAGNTNLRRVLNQNHPQAEKFRGTPFSNVWVQHSDGTSSYNGFQANLTKRFSRGFQMTHAYTWSHAIDTASDQEAWDQPFDKGTRRGNAAHDRRHVYAATYVYEIPWHERKSDRLASCWAVGACRE